MQYMDTVRRAARNLRRSKGRTLLTSLAIAVGAFTIALALAAGTGGRDFINDITDTSGDARSLQIYPRFEQEAPTSSDEMLPEYGAKEAEPEGTVLTERDVKRVSKVKGVESVSAMLDVDVSYVTRGDDQPKRVANVTTRADRTKLNLAAGSLTDGMLEPGQAIVSREYLQSFGINSSSDALGKSLYLAVEKPGEQNPKLFEAEIVAVDEKSDSAVYYAESIKLSPEDMRQMFDYQQSASNDDQFWTLMALLNDSADIEATQQAVKDLGYEVYSVFDTRQTMLQMVTIAQWGLAGFGALAVLASVFGVINTQYISVLERTQQIGLIKALGASRRDVSRMFRYEAAWIGLLGGVLGSVLAYLVTLLNPVISSALGLDSGTHLLRFNWFGAVILVLSLMLVAIASGWLPSRRAAKLDPIEALRTE